VHRSGLSQSSSDVGSHLLDVRKPLRGGIGLTLINRESRIGCAISDVDPGGMGEAAGLCVGDVILAIDGSIQNETIAMSNAIAAASGLVSLEVAGAMPSRRVRSALPLGVTLRSTSCRVGVLVTEVSPGGPASRGALVVGDIILAVNGKPVETAERALKELGLKDAANKPCDLVVAGALVTIDPATTC